MHAPYVQHISYRPIYQVTKYLPIYRPIDGSIASFGDSSSAFIIVELDPSDTVLEPVVLPVPVRAPELRLSELRPCSATVAGVRRRRLSASGIDEGTGDVASHLFRSSPRARH